MPKRIIRFDASLLRQASCIRRVRNIALEGFRGETSHPMAIYGSGFHVFKEVLVTTKDEHKAMMMAHKSFREEKPTPMKTYQWATIEHLTKTCLEFIEHKKNNPSHTLETDGKLHIERTFNIPLYEDDDLIIVLCGTIDEKERIPNGCYAISDEKVTSQQPEGFFDKFRLDPQLLTYIWAIRWHATKYPDSIYAEMAKTKIAGFINGVFVSQHKPAIFQRSNAIFFTEQQFDEFEFCLDVLKTRLIAAYYSGYFPREGILNGSCQNGFFPCPYAAACSAPDEAAEQAILRRWFIQKEYDPLMFRALPK